LERAEADLIDAEKAHELAKSQGQGTTSGQKLEKLKTLVAAMREDLPKRIAAAKERAYNTPAKV
jgi:hypothetical protein